MSTRFYQAPGLDIRRMAYDLSGILHMQGYQVQQFGNRGQMMVQLRKGGDFEALLGMQAALTVTLQTTPRGVIAVIGQQQWIDKAAAGVLGFMLLWPLAITAGAGMVRQAALEGEIFQTLDTVTMQQRTDVHMGPVPPDLEPQASQLYQDQPYSPQPPPQYGPYAPPPPRPQGPPNPPPPPPPPAQQAAPQRPPQQPPAPEKPPASEAIPLPGRGQKVCSNCQEVNDADDLYCSRCGTSLKVAEQPRTCANCHAPLKPGAAFCTKCGTATPQAN